MGNSIISSIEDKYGIMRKSSSNVFLIERFPSGYRYIFKMLNNAKLKYMPRLFKKNKKKFLF